MVSILLQNMSFAFDILLQILFSAGQVLKFKHIHNSSEMASKIVNLDEFAVYYGFRIAERSLDSRL